MNKVMLVGYCADTPILVPRKNGKYIANFVVYTHDLRYGQEIHRCALYDGRAECLTEQFHKGSLVVIIGRIKNTTKEMNGHRSLYSTIVVEDYQIPPKHNKRLLADLMQDIYGGDDGQPV